MSSSSARRHAVAYVAALVLGAVGCGGRGASSPANVDAAPGEVVAPDVSTLTPEDAPLVLRRSAVADQWFWLRARVLDGDVPPGFERARSAMQDLRTVLGGEVASWEEVEVVLGSARSADDLVKAFESLPVERVENGFRSPFRAPAQGVARELRATEKLYRRGPYAEHVVAIDRAAADLATTLRARGDELAETMRKDMRAEQPLPPVALTLVADAPYAAVFAADAHGQKAAVFLRVRGLEGGALLETALAESLHAIDELTVRSPDTAMNVLRAALAKQGMGEDDSNVEMVVNTVTFAEAASLVRRFADPGHRALGESGFYELYAPAKDIVAAWERHLAGEPLEKTADAIARAVAAPAP